MGDVTVEYLELSGDVTLEYLELSGEVTEEYLEEYLDAAVSLSVSLLYDEYLLTLNPPPPENTGRTRN